MKTIRHLHLVGATGTIRTAVYDNREHLVVPVVAMVEGVVWAVNSDVPEFVPAEELANTPHQWNGRGCFAGHPEDGGTQVTANTPRTLEKSFGLVFDTVDSKRILATRRLELFAWLDPAKAAAIGAQAADVVRRLRAGETVEVSVGCFVEADDVDGEFNGKQYHGVWRDIVSDHLAFLAADEKGACSVEAGCGAGRRATRHLITAEGIRREEAMPVPSQRPPKATPPSMKDRVKAFLKTLQEDPAEDTAELIGYNTMSALVDQAVVALGEAGKTVAALLLDENTESTGDEEAEESVEDARLDALRTQCMTVYSLLSGVMEMCWTMQQDEADDVQSVYVVNAAKRVATEAKAKVDPTALLAKLQTQLKALGAKPCACDGQPRQAATPPAEKESEIMKERIAALMVNPHNAFKNQAFLETLNEVQVKTLEDHCTSLKTAADKKIADDEAAAKLAAASAKPALTRAEIFAADPSLAHIVTEHEARVAAEKSSLVASLKACGVKTEEQLKVTPIEELRTMAAFAKVAQVDFSGLGVAIVPGTTVVEDLTPPSSYAAGLKALREADTKH